MAPAIARQSRIRLPAECRDPALFAPATDLSADRVYDGDAFRAGWAQQGIEGEMPLEFINYPFDGRNGWACSQRKTPPFADRAADPRQTLAAGLRPRSNAPL